MDLALTGAILFMIGYAIHATKPVGDSHREAFARGFGMAALAVAAVGAVLVTAAHLRWV